MPPEAVPTPPSATPAAPKRSGPGCLALAIALPLVILTGIVVGTVLNRPDDPAEEKTATVADGVIGDTAWRVDALRDVDGEVCAFLYADGVQVAGSCEDTPEVASFDAGRDGDGTDGDGDDVRTVVFGKAPADTSDTADDTDTDRPVELQVLLDDADTLTVEAHPVDGIEGRFYAEVVDGDVGVQRLIER